MNWLLSILKLVPYIAAGVHLIHSDATAGEKTKIATDLIGVSTAASQEVLTGDNKDLAAAIGQTAQTTVESIIAALHTSGTLTTKAS